MRSQFHFMRGGAGGTFWQRHGALAGILLALFALSPIARAESAPPGAVARVDGNDISIESGTAAQNGSSSVAPGIYVSNGSTVTVHAGHARMTLFAGGTVIICGPAKFTVLTSADAITVALNFGRLRVELPAKTALRVFTPTIIGTPIDISGGARDVTVGLNLDDSLCVVATSGAIQLEHQFTGEKLIVPQAGEFFLNAGKLMPVAGSPGSCQCLEAESRPAPALPAAVPEFAVATPPPTAAAALPPVNRAPEPDPPVQPSVEYSVLAHGNDAHPSTPAKNDAAPAAVPVSMPVYTAVLPPLTFSANSPAPPPDTSAEMVLLIREAQVSPDWEFSGHVAAPGFAEAMQHALGQGTSKAAEQAPTQSQPSEQPRKKKGGFWASLKKAFGGGS